MTWFRRRRSPPPDAEADMAEVEHKLADLKVLTAQTAVKAEQVAAEAVEVRSLFRELRQRLIADPFLIGPDRHTRVRKPLPKRS